MGHILEDNLDKETASPSDATDTKPVANQDTASSEFFDMLDRAVTPNTFSDKQPSPQATPQAPEEGESQDDPISVTPENHDWKKRYDDSSREARRMKQRLDEVSPYMPVIDALKTDPEFLEYIKGYANQDKEEPDYEKIVKESGLGDDFAFDAEEAISNPNSASGKVLRALVDTVASQRAKESQDQTFRAVRDYMEAEAFKRDNNLTEEQFDKVANFAKNLNLDWDQIYSLMKASEKSDVPGAATPQPQKPAIQKKATQPKENKFPQSLSSAGSAPVETDDVVQQVFNIIKSGHDQRNITNLMDKLAKE